MDFYVIFGALLVFTGFYLIVKEVYARVKYIVMDARFVGYSDEKGTLYPAFEFTYNGEEYTMTSSVPVKNPDKYKHQVGEIVAIRFSPKNSRYIDVVGETNVIFLYAAASIALGAILAIASIMR